MMNFNYKVKDKTGRTLDGSMVGDDRRAVVARLQEQGYYVLEVRETRTPSETANLFSHLMRWTVNPVFGGASVGQMAVFYRQFATLLHAGMSIGQAMTSLSSQGGSRVLRNAARETLVFVNNGGRLSDAFARYPWIFPELHINLIRAGESSGMIEQMVNRIADYLERENQVRTRLRFATLYPKILVLAVIFVPKFPILIFGGFNAYYHATMGILFPVLAWVAGIWVAFRLLNQIPPVRSFTDAAKLGMPRVGKAVKMLALSKFYRVLGAMYASGTPLSRGLFYAANAAGNRFLTTRLKRACPVVDRGGKLSDGLRDTRVLPSIALDMIATGEQTGNVDEMLDKTAEYTENDAEVLVFQTTMILGVLLILAIAAYIGWFVVGFYAGQYKSIMDFKE